MTNAVNFKLYKVSIQAEDGQLTCDMVWEFENPNASLVVPMLLDRALLTAGKNLPLSLLYYVF